MSLPKTKKRSLAAFSPKPAAQATLASPALLRAVVSLPQPAAVPASSPAPTPTPTPAGTGPGSGIQVHRYPQPKGQNGVRYSLDQVAEYASEGRFEPRVISWTTHQLQLHGFPKTDFGKAEAIHEGILRDISWVPDSVDSEVIRNPKYMLPDPVTGEKAMFVAGDCDDITSVELACLMSVGVRTAVLGHSYEDDQEIGHVLGEFWDSAAKRWRFIDGSVRQLKIGEAFEPTHSRRIELPTKIVSCDTSGQCPIGSPPSIPGDNIQFVGLSGPPINGGSASVVGEAALVGSAPSFDPLLSVDAGFEDGYPAYLAAATERADRAWQSLLVVHGGLRAVLKSLGTGIGGPEIQPFWSSAEQQQLLSAGVKAEILGRGAKEVLEGKRQLLVTGDAGHEDLAITTIPGDNVKVVEDASGLLVAVNLDGTPHVVPANPSGTLAGISWAQTSPDKPAPDTIGTMLMLKALTDYFEELRHYLALKTRQFLHEQEKSAPNAIRRRGVVEASQIFDAAESRSQISAPPPPQASYTKAVGESASLAVWAMGSVAVLFAIANWSDNQRAKRKEKEKEKESS